MFVLCDISSYSALSDLIEHVYSCRLHTQFYNTGYIILTNIENYTIDIGNVALCNTKASMKLAFIVATEKTRTHKIHGTAQVVYLRPCRGNPWPNCLAEFTLESEHACFGRLTDRLVMREDKEVWMLTGTLNDMSSRTVGKKPALLTDAYNDIAMKRFTL